MVCMGNEFEQISAVAQRHYALGCVDVRKWKFASCLSHGSWAACTAALPRHARHAAHGCLNQGMKAHEFRIKARKAHKAHKTNKAHITNKAHEAHIAVQCVLYK